MCPGRTNKAEQLARSLSAAQSLWPGQVGAARQDQLKELVNSHSLSVSAGDLLLIEGNWYVTHGGLLRIARRNRCSGIHTETVSEFCNPAQGRWVVKATVFKTSRSKGFVGYGDADPGNVSNLVHGAEMRIAETRAVNRALRKAYGIGLCSAEEIGSPPDKSARFGEPLSGSDHDRTDRRDQRADQNQPRLRDRLRLLIRQHDLDPSQVKRYAAEFCHVQSLREASREQIQELVEHLASLGEQGRETLVARLQSSAGENALPKEAA
jgi:hypothetical protein